MPNDPQTTVVPARYGVVGDMIRIAVTTGGFPVAGLLDIARERLREHPEPSAQWELAAIEGESAKPIIETRSGPAFSTEEVAAKLKRSGETIRSMVKNGELIAYPKINGRGWCFPMWQFARGAPADWIVPLLKAYGHNGWGLLDFVTVPRFVEANGFTTSYSWLDRLKDLHVDQVLAAARRSNPD